MGGVTYLTIANNNYQIRPLFVLPIKNHSPRFTKLIYHYIDNVAIIYETDNHMTLDPGVEENCNQLPKGTSFIALGVQSNKIAITTETVAPEVTGSAILTDTMVCLAFWLQLVQLQPFMQYSQIATAGHMLLHHNQLAYLLGK